jgi:hypothetical protein
MWKRRRPDQQSLFRRVVAAGCPLDFDIPEARQLGGVLVEQHGEAHLFELQPGGTAIVIDLWIGRKEPGEVRIERFGELRGPWGSWIPDWLRPLPAGENVYRLANDFVCERELVLNERLDESGIILRRGHHVEGLLLGHALETIPAALRHGELVEAEFSMRDFFGYASSAAVRFMVNRSQSAARPATGQHAGFPGSNRREDRVSIFSA